MLKEVTEFEMWRLSNINQKKQQPKLIKWKNY